MYLIKDGTLFLLYGRKDFEKMTNRKYEYVKGLNGHTDIALYVDTFEEVDAANADIAESKLKEMNADYIILESDISNEDAVKEIYSTVMEHKGVDLCKIDTLVM